MPNITAADVKRLRDATGAGMMDAKKALQETDGDFDEAVEVLRVKGAAKAVKRSAERTAAEGLVAAEGNALIELACETDFVAKNADIQKLAADIASVVEATGTTEVAEILAETIPGGTGTVGDAISNAAAVIGEKIELKRAARLEGQVATYLHRRSADLPPQVGVLVSYTGEGAAAATVARDAAMQVAALRALYAKRDDVPEAVVADERRIAEATAREEGKPDQALPKIVEGRLNGYFKETVLVDQPSVKESKKTVGAVLAEAGADVTGFVRFEVGA
jgi:elongation factor Ts